MGAALPAAAGIMTAFAGEDLPIKASSIAASSAEALAAIFMTEATFMGAVTADTANLSGFSTLTLWTAGHKRQPFFLKRTELAA